MRDHIKLMVHESFLNFCEAREDEQARPIGGNPVKAKRMAGLSGRRRTNNPLATAATIATLGAAAAAGAYGVNQIVNDLQRREQIRDTEEEIRRAEQRIPPLRKLPFQR